MFLNVSLWSGLWSLCQLFLAVAARPRRHSRLLESQSMSSYVTEDSLLWVCWSYGSTRNVLQLGATHSWIENMDPICSLIHFPCRVVANRSWQCFIIEPEGCVCFVWTVSWWRRKFEMSCYFISSDVSAFHKLIWWRRQDLHFSCRACQCTTLSMSSF